MHNQPKCSTPPLKNYYSQHAARSERHAQECKGLLWRTVVGLLDRSGEMLERAERPAVGQPRHRDRCIGMVPQPNRDRRPAVDLLIAGMTRPSASACCDRNGWPLIPSSKIRERTRSIRSYILSSSVSFCCDHSLSAIALPSADLVRSSAEFGAFMLVTVA